MEPFTRVSAVAVPLDLPNVDTDRILPARFLRKPRSTRYERFLFYDLRFAEDGSAKADFVLNRPAYRDARILVAAENFGCGSSREGAVWALGGYGFRAVVAPSFGDIFSANALKNGMVPIVLPAEVVARLRHALHERPGAGVTVDLSAQTVEGPVGAVHRFEIDPFRKECLLQGRDEIDLTQAHEADIRGFEERRARELPWLADAGA